MTISITPDKEYTTLELMHLFAECTASEDEGLLLAKQLQNSLAIMMNLHGADVVTDNLKWKENHRRNRLIVMEARLKKVSELFPNAEAVSDVLNTLNLGITEDGQHLIHIDKVVERAAETRLMLHGSQTRPWQFPEKMVGLVWPEALSWPKLADFINWTIENRNFDVLSSSHMLRFFKDQLNRIPGDSENFQVFYLGHRVQLPGTDIGSLSAFHTVSLHVSNVKQVQVVLETRCVGDHERIYNIKFSTGEQGLADEIEQPVGAPVAPTEEKAEPDYSTSELLELIRAEALDEHAAATIALLINSKLGTLHTDITTTEIPGVAMYSWERLEEQVRWVPIMSPYLSSTGRTFANSQLVTDVDFVLTLPEDPQVRALAFRSAKAHYSTCIQPSRIAINYFTVKTWYKDGQRKLSMNPPDETVAFRLQENAQPEVIQEPPMTETETPAPSLIDEDPRTRSFTKEVREKADTHANDAPEGLPHLLDDAPFVYPEQMTFHEFFIWIGNRSEGAKAEAFIKQIAQADRVGNVFDPMSAQWSIKLIRVADAYPVNESRKTVILGTIRATVFKHNLVNSTSAKRAEIEIITRGNTAENKEWITNVVVRDMPILTLKEQKPAAEATPEVLAEKTPESAKSANPMKLVLETNNPFVFFNVARQLGGYMTDGKNAKRLELFLQYLDQIASTYEHLTYEINADSTIGELSLHAINPTTGAQEASMILDYNPVA